MNKGFDKESFVAVKRLLLSSLFLTIRDKYKDKLLKGSLMLVKIGIVDGNPSSELVIKVEGKNFKVVIPKSAVFECISHLEIPNDCSEIEIVVDKSIFLTYDVIRMFRRETDFYIISEDNETGIKSFVMLLDGCSNVVVRNSMFSESRIIFKMIEKFRNDLKINNTSEELEYCNNKNVYVIRQRCNKVIINRSFFGEGCENVIFFNRVDSGWDVSSTILDIRSYLRYYNKSRWLGKWDACWVER